MKQYCRYCIHLCWNNVIWCGAHEKVKSYSSCKRPNKCKEFQLAECEPEYQDALFENVKGYKPKSKYKKKINDGEQETMF